jgi:hypothetical protein
MASTRSPPKAPAPAAGFVWDMDWARFDAWGGRVRKLSVIDTDTGMTAEELAYVMNQLAASSRDQCGTGDFCV